MDTDAFSAPSMPSSSSPCSRSFVDRVRKGFHFLVFSVMGNMFFAILTFIFASVGTLLGAMTGALIGQETETGFVRGATIGAISGAVFSIDVFESSLLLWQSNGSKFSCLLYLVDVVASLLSGRLLRERLGPAMLDAVQTQMGALEMNSEEEPSNIFDTGSDCGLPCDSLHKIPMLLITKKNSIDSFSNDISCIVCLQDFCLGEAVRRLPYCHHMFHLPCIDKWLLRHASCPLCRRNI